MSVRERISAGQLFALLYISRMVVNVTYSRYHSDINDLKYGVFSSLTALFFTLVMLIPVHLVIRSGNGRNILDSSFTTARPFSFAVALLYGIYFLWVLVYTVSFFDTMTSNVFDPNLSVTVLSAVGILSTIYGAYKGIQTLGRASTLFLVLIGIALVILTGTLIPKADFLNFEPLSADNIPSVTEMTVSALSKNSCIPAMALLIPLTDGNRKMTSLLWATAVYLSMSVIALLIIAVLGEYTFTQTFPVYTLTAVASLGVTRRLDGIFMGVWLLGMFVKVSLFIALFAMCVNKFFGEKKAKTAVFLCGGAVFGLSLLVNSVDGIADMLFNVYFAFGFTLLTAVVLPLVVTITNICKKKHVR